MSLSYWKDLSIKELDYDWTELLTARRYQGAAVEIFERGIHRGKVWHVDVSSMYPNIMIVFNLSPESLKLVKKKRYTGQYILTPTYIEVPDATLNCQLCVRISEEDSISRKILEELYREREETKYNMSESERVKGYGENVSMSLGIKLIMNAMYGYNGMEYSRYGSYLVAILCCAIGRFILEKSLAWLKKQGCKPIEMDTDGIYGKGEFDKEELNSFIQKLLEDFPLRSRLSLDSEVFEGMIAVKMKNYVLRYHGENIFKGSGFHGKGIPDVCEDALEKVVTGLFEGQDMMPIWYKCQQMLFDTKISDFEMTCSPTKPADEYDDGSMYAKLLKQLPNFEWGGEIRYVKSKDGYTPIGAVEDHLIQIDFNYYYGRMKDVIDRLLEPISEYEEVEPLYKHWNRRKARKCTDCGKRLNKTVRYLETDMCWGCA